MTFAPEQTLALSLSQCSPKSGLIGSLERFAATMSLCANCANFRDQISRYQLPLDPPPLKEIEKLDSAGCPTCAIFITIRSAYNIVETDHPVTLGFPREQEDPSRQRLNIIFVISRARFKHSITITCSSSEAMSFA